MEDRSGLGLETCPLPSGSTQGKRQIAGEQKSVSAPCVLQSCARERSCFALLVISLTVLGLLQEQALLFVTQMKVVLSALQQPGAGR